jgi:hypothetical protein
MRDTVYQPYPGGPPPADQRPPAPASVRYAVWLMYAGAAASLLKVTAVLVTWGTVRTAMRLALKNGARHVTPAPTASQLNAGITTTLAVVVVTGLIAAGLWIFLARATRSGSGRARVTGTVLFALDTAALLIGPPDVGLRGAGALLARAGTVLVWLAGLGAVVFLWQRESSAFLAAPPAR